MSVDGSVEWVWSISVNTHHPAIILTKKDLDLDIVDVVTGEVFPGSFGEVKGARITATGTPYESEPVVGLRCFWDEERAEVSVD